MISRCRFFRIIGTPISSATNAATVMAFTMVKPPY
jgi:hypothetical protein